VRARVFSAVARLLAHALDKNGRRSKQGVAGWQHLGRHSTVGREACARTCLCPAQACPSSIFRDTNRCDIGESQSKWTAYTMETPGVPSAREALSARCHCLCSFSSAARPSCPSCARTAPTASAARACAAPSSARSSLCALPSSRACACQLGGACALSVGRGAGVRPSGGALSVVLLLTPPECAASPPAPRPVPPPPPAACPPIGSPCTQCLRHGDPMHAHE
jgi:hypothetical protein